MFEVLWRNKIFVHNSVNKLYVLFVYHGIITHVLVDNMSTTLTCRRYKNDHRKSLLLTTDQSCLNIWFCSFFAVFYSVENCRSSFLLIQQWRSIYNKSRLDSYPKPFYRNFKVKILSVYDHCTTIRAWISHSRMDAVAAVIHVAQGGK